MILSRNKSWFLFRKKIPLTPIPPYFGKKSTLHCFFFVYLIFYFEYKNILPTFFSNLLKFQQNVRNVLWKQNNTKMIIITICEDFSFCKRFLLLFKRIYFCRMSVFSSDPYTLENQM
jgi:hypothetical protein